MVYDKGQLNISRIDRESEDSYITVFLPVQNEQFHLAIRIKTHAVAEICGIWVEPFTDLYFQASSYELTIEEMASLTELQATDG